MDTFKWIPLNQLSVPSRDMQKLRIAYISKWNCNSPQWCASRVYGWGRVVKLPHPSQILRTASVLLKILSKKFPSLFPSHLFHYEKKEKKKLLNCFEGKGQKFPKYHYTSQSRSTHDWSSFFLSGFSMSWQYEWISRRK